MIVLNKKFFLRMILIILIGCTLFFIWSNSLECAETSSDKSGRVVEIVKPIIDPDDRMDIETVTKIVRKFAHFSEFALLGAEVCLFFFTFEKFRYFTLPSFFITVGMCYGVAVIDELLQLISSGRSCEFTDTLVDLSGIIAGVIFGIFVRFVFRKIRKLIIK